MISKPTDTVSTSLSPTDGGTAALVLASAAEASTVAGAMEGGLLATLEVEVSSGFE